MMTDEQSTSNRARLGTTGLDLRERCFLTALSGVLASGAYPIKDCVRMADRLGEEALINQLAYEEKEWEKDPKD